MRNWSLPEIAALAREMAMAIKPPDAIREKLGITDEEFEEIQQSPVYLNVYKTFVLEWEAATSTNKRLAVQAAAALEDILPDVIHRLRNDKEALPGVISGLQWLAKVAGADAVAASGGGGAERFKITINLGPSETLDANKTVTIENHTEEPPKALSAPVEETVDLSGFE
jgi:hypothetical protein